MCVTTEPIFRCCKDGESFKDEDDDDDKCKVDVPWSSCERHWSHQSRCTQLELLPSGRVFYTSRAVEQSVSELYTMGNLSDALTFWVLETVFETSACQVINITKLKIETSANYHD